jgi:predicted enzyme related to lactoylglutathione lyase
MMGMVASNSAGGITSLVGAAFRLQVTSDRVFRCCCGFGGSSPVVREIQNYSAPLAAGGESAARLGGRVSGQGRSSDRWSPTRLRRGPRVAHFHDLVPEGHNDGSHTTAAFGDQQLLGVMDGAGFLSEGVPSNWTIFFGAEDVDKTLQEITENGGAVLRPAEDTPYGRLAAGTDPTGTAFNLSSLQN